MKHKWLIAGPLILIELALCVAIVGVLWAGIVQARAGGFVWNVFSVDTVAAEAVEAQTFTVAGPATLTLTSQAGNVTVTGGEGDAIMVQAHKTAWGPNANAAEAELAALNVSMTQSGEAVTIKVTEPEQAQFTRQPNLVAFTITVPSETAVNIDTNFGNVTLSNTTGDVDLNTDFGNVTLAGVTADNVGANSNAGAISLMDVLAENDVVLDTDFGKISFERGTAGSLTVKTNSGNVTLESLTVSGAVDVQNDFGTITLTNVGTDSYDVHTNSGAIIIDGASGALKAHSDFGKVAVINAEDVTLDLKTNSGAITFSGSLGEGPHTLTADFGNIQLSLPTDSALTIDLKTDFGKIGSAFPITVNGELDNHWQGALNGGGASLTVETNSGTITLDILKP